MPSIRNRLETTQQLLSAWGKDYSHCYSSTCLRRPDPRVIPSSSTSDCLSYAKHFMHPTGREGSTSTGHFVTLPIDLPTTKASWEILNGATSRTLQKSTVGQCSRDRSKISLFCCTEQTDSSASHLSHLVHTPTNSGQDT